MLCNTAKKTPPLNTTRRTLEHFDETVEIVWSNKKGNNILKKRSSRLFECSTRRRTRMYSCSLNNRCLAYGFK